MLLVLIIILILMAVGALPSNGFHNFGYAPSGLLTVLIVVILVVLLLRGRL